MEITHPPAWPTSYYNSKIITDALNRPIVAMRLVEYSCAVDLEITYGDNGEIVVVHVADGCGCCGSPSIPDEP